MAKLKAYTDLEQSRKLAEILQPKSADMIWYGVYRGMDGKYYHDENNELGVIVINEETCKKLFRVGDEYINWLPCWSLSALLNVLPEASLNTFKDKNWNAMVKHNDKMIYGDKYDPVDACYELILKLYELKLL